MGNGPMHSRSTAESGLDSVLHFKEEDKRFE